MLVKLSQPLLPPPPLLPSTTTRSHNILVSGTASGDLHFWDTATGAFVFGSTAQHPNDAGISAMGSSEGCAAGGRCSEGSSGLNNATAAAAAAAAVEVANLTLYTACEEGFVKTWKIGWGFKGGVGGTGMAGEVGRMACRNWGSHVQAVFMLSRITSPSTHNVLIVSNV